MHTHVCIYIYLYTHVSIYLSIYLSAVTYDPHSLGPRPPLVPLRIGTGIGTAIGIGIDIVISTYLDGHIYTTAAQWQAPQPFAAGRPGKSKNHLKFGCSGMWCLRMWGLKTLFLKPLTLISFRCEVPAPSVVEGQQTTIFKSSILKHHIPELPKKCYDSTNIPALVAPHPPGGRSSSTTS